nr:antitoxin VbhA family protein [Histophilus somni]
MNDEKLTPEVLDRRAYHVRNALASFALEGEYPSNEAEDLFNKFASGEIETMDELRVQINLLYSED